jgi:hypothetical protein
MRRSIATARCRAWSSGAESDHRVCAALQLHSRGANEGSKRCARMARAERDLRAGVPLETKGERTPCLRCHSSVRTCAGAIGRQANLVDPRGEGIAQSATRCAKQAEAAICSQ